MKTGSASDDIDIFGCLQELRNVGAFLADGFQGFPHGFGGEVEAVMEQIKKQTESIIRIGFGESDEIQLETVPENQIPALFALPLQLMANYKSVSLGRDPDHPQHLTKVVK